VFIARRASATAADKLAVFSLDGRFDGVGLVRLMFEEAGYDMFQGSLTIAESETSRGWRGIELLVSEVGQEAECVSSNGQPFE
jgi:hypothetical protein